MKTLFEKIWERHVVKQLDENTAVLYIDRHYIHEVTSPQAFQALKEKGVHVFRSEKTTATADHNVPTINQHLPIENKASRLQVSTLEENCEKEGITHFGLGHKNQGIVHVIGPELGLTQPGMTIVCGDSHTSTHGAFGAIAFGVGTSQVGQVLASQCTIVSKPKNLRIVVNGLLRKNVTPKDVILYIISKLGTDSGTGYFIEFSGNIFREMSMEGRMTVCNMSIEMGARGGLVAVDGKTISYLEKALSREGRYEEWQSKKAYWKTLQSDKEAVFDHEYTFEASDIFPMVTYGTNPGMARAYDQKIPSKKGQKKALDYMGFKEGDSLVGLRINHVFVGSCTNARIEDFRLFTRYIKGKQKAENVTAYLVPGSQKVSRQIKEEGLLEIIEQAGFELREPGCSACLAMNEDKIPEGEYCISTSNRNFEGRQGRGARTLLASPLIAASVAIEGKIIKLQ